MIKDILDDLRLHADSEGNLSRAKYREVGTYSTEKIQSVFGSFREARRQAGLEPTRGQTQVLNQIARHVSHDEYRQFVVDRKDYGEKFRRPDSKRFQSLLVCTDVHDIECDPFWRRVFLDTIKRVKPDKIVFGEIYLIWQSSESMGLTLVSGMQSDESSGFTLSSRNAEKPQETQLSLF